MSYADAWSKWFDVIEGGACALSAQMIEAIDLTKALRVLDVGTGLGEPATRIARSLPPDGRVTAIDHDARMIDFARARAAQMRVGNIDFQVGNAGSVDLGECEYDAITARWSLMFVGDKPAVLKKLHRAMRPGGRIAVGLWREGDRVPALTLAEQAIFERFDWPDEERSSRQAFSMADEEETTRLFTDSGFRDVSTTSCEIVYEFETPRSYIRYREDVQDAVWSKVARMSPNDLVTAYDAVERALEPYLTADGTCRIVSDAYCLAATAT